MPGPAADERAGPVAGGDVRSPSRLPAIDGLRGVAVVGVIAFHLGATWLRGGFLGVDLFFVVSGFVITRLLIVERTLTGAVSLRRFWERRARRLIPSVLLVIAVVALWSLQRPSLVDPTVRGQGLAALVYGSNWYNIFAEVGYWDAGLDASPLNHLWSLAIEEQFYVVWPLVVVAVLRLARRRWRPALLAVTGVAIAVSGTLQVVLARTHGTSRAYFGSDTRAIAILLGAAIALLVVDAGPAGPVERLGWWGRRGGRHVDKGPSAATWLVSTVAAIPAIGFLAWQWGVADVGDEALYHGRLILASVAGGAVVAVVVLVPRHPVARLLALPPLVGLGVRSYALYLWHFPVLVILDEERFGRGGLGLLAARLLLTGLLSEVSMRLVENPIRHARDLRGRPLVAALVVPAVLVAIVCSRIGDGPVDPTQSSRAPVIGRAVPSGATVLVVGDSWSRNLGEGMRASAGEQVQIVNLGQGGCGIADPTNYRTSDRGDFPIPADCLGWADRWTGAIEQYRPQAVVVQVGNWDQALQEIGGAWVRPCDPAFDQHYAGQLDRAIEVAGAGGALVVLPNVRDGEDGPLRDLSDCMNELLAAAHERHPEVLALDLAGLLCPGRDGCPEEMDGDDVYDETGHLAPAWSERVGQWVLDEIAGQVPAVSPATSTTTMPSSSPSEPTATDPPADGGASAVLPTEAELQALGASDIQLGEVTTDPRQVLELLGPPDESWPADLTAQAAVDGRGPGVEVRALVVTTGSDQTADAIARRSIDQALADGAVSEGASADQLSTVYVRRLDPRVVLLVVRRVEGVLLVWVKGGTPPAAGSMLAAGEGVAARLAQAAD